jgi:tetratricopeptide (TPR) repeat protein
MRQGAQLAIAVSVIVTGCTAAPGDKIKIRPIGDAAAQTRPANEQIAFARGQLTMGGVGLALEAFRKAAREQPDNVDALAGIADSYAAMGRYDLARRYYEAALALAPRDPTLLQAVAMTGPNSDPALAQRPSVQTPAAAPPMLARAESALPSAAATATMKLPPIRAPQTPPVASLAPRLERLSPGEVALVTTARPIWKEVVVARTRVSTTVRWLPLRSASAQPQIRLLNAARRQGLAAHTRQLLTAHGWRKLEIGDAPKVRSTSIVLYPARSEDVARSLAEHLGFRAVSQPRGGEIIVLLGRDTARVKPRQLRG